MGWVDLTEIVSTNPPTKKEIQQVLEFRRRRAKARFLADENFPTLAIEALRRMGARVVRVQDLNRNGHPDEDHSTYALKHGYILISCDRDFLNEKRFPLVHCPTIVVCDFGSGTLEEILQSYTCVRRILSAPQFYDKWTKIDANRESWTESSRFLDGTTARTRYRVYRGTMQEWV